jgi:hypothetical protein
MQRGPGAAQVPGQVAGEHADQHVGPDAFFEPVEDRAQVQVVGFDRPEVPLDVFEVLVGGHHGGCVEFGGGDGGAQHVEPVQGGFGVDVVLAAGHGQAVISDRQVEVLEGPRLVIGVLVAGTRLALPELKKTWELELVGVVQETTTVAVAGDPLKLTLETFTPETAGPLAAAVVNVWSAETVRPNVPLTEITA